MVTRAGFIKNTRYVYRNCFNKTQDTERTTKEDITRKLID